MFVESIFCAAHSQELCRKAAWWDGGVAKQKKQQCSLLLCNAAKGHSLSNVHLGTYGALSLSSNCLQDKRHFWFEALVCRLLQRTGLFVN